MCESGTNCKISEEEWRLAISILIRNYHAVNKKLSGVKCLSVYAIKEGGIDINNFPAQKDVDEFPKVLAACGVDFQTSSEDSLFEVLKGAGSESCRQYVLVSKLFYKQNTRPASRIAQIIDLTHANFHCIPLDAPDNSDSKFRFNVSLRNGELHVDVTEPCNEKEKMLNWIKFVLQPKLLKWARSGSKDGKTKSNKSLGLVDIEDYTNLYAALKEKYGKDLVDRWTETTDPLKFVYEDVAIATYLILLWRKLGDVPNNFIDMGCGNGLLVHILNSEGYHGYGVDIRKRKIWDIYPETTKLKEHTIMPNDYNAYKDVDWIIGNHSDELSPWIPVITAMSSYKTKYFLLPCCAYEFSGKKFQRRCANESVYNDFLNYVQEISAKCQFKTDIDRLKIPSTKRVAIIGSARSYLEEEYQNICQEIDSFVKSEIQRTNCVDLKLREKEEAVRNCTKIDKNIIDNIVMNIFQYILRDDGHNERVEKWRSGRSVTLQELASFLSKDDLKNIKSECGGLKTLIKNKHEIFEVLGDKVKLRYPRRKEEMTKIVKFKRRPCFFYLHHPDGCALTSIECTFVHERINV